MILDNLRAMAVFVAVVRHGSFSGAAKELGITTSAVSQQIRSLENELGAVLLQRSTRKVSLTEVGELFHQSAMQMVAAAQMGWHQVSCFRDEIMGNLSIKPHHSWLILISCLPCQIGWYNINRCRLTLYWVVNSLI